MTGAGQGQSRGGIARALYERLWRVLVEWFRVPREPPTLSAPGSGETRTFNPAPGYLRYCKFWFWVVLLLVDMVILFVWLVILSESKLAGLVLLPLALALAVIPVLLAFVAIHLRYENTWYVMNERSLRIRRGVWTISEMTLTFENVQNVRVSSGPVQRYFGIANVVMETAAAGNASVANAGVIEGIDNPRELRDRIMTRVRASRTAGLGDEGASHGGARRETRGRSGPGRSGAWSPAHLAALREIRDAVRALHA